MLKAEEEGHTLFNGFMCERPSYSGGGTCNYRKPKPLKIRLPFSNPFANKDTT